MSMVVVAYRLTPDQLADVRSAPDRAVEALLEQDEDPERTVDLDKAWHGLHTLLNQHPTDINCPAGAAILGGLPVGEDQGYGPARLLDVVGVTQVASALAALSDDDVMGRYDASKMRSWDVYPSIWDDPKILTEYLLPHLTALRSLYTAAAAAGEPVLLVTA